MPAAWAVWAKTVVACRRCPRLWAWREAHRGQPGTAVWGRPVVGEGDFEAELVVLGLAPGLRGAHRTGRPFWGDASGRWVREALAAHGWVDPVRGVLVGAFVTNVVRCAPPQNRPWAKEVAACRAHLAAELALLPKAQVVVALGREAFFAYWALRRPGTAPPPFRHGAAVRFPDPPHWLLASYHPSPLNRATGRLDAAAWAGVFARAQALLTGGDYGPQSTPLSGN
ncbi:MAG: uracil-DNA glycosylase [Firmicutes bacterium]|nr:uracil-DNA glycosylase [Alicyclobacillaceae bacterium]MCL6496919.1 uracil-DNA glycosylase [Bacillota bacterium]